MKEENKKIDQKQILTQLRQDTLEEFIKSVKDNDGNWSKDWDIQTLLAKNHITGKFYGGGNLVRCSKFATKMKSKDNRWMTFKQIKDNNLILKKGAKSIKLEYWEMKPKSLAKIKQEFSEDKAKDVLKDYINMDEDVIDKNINNLSLDEIYNRLREYLPKIAIGKTFNVFNGQDIEGLPELEQLVIKDDEKEIWEIADDLVKSSKVEINEVSVIKPHTITSFTNNKEIKKITINIPPKESYKDAKSYLATLLHEMAHSIQPRKYEKTSTDYAKEELVAEMATMIVQARLGIDIRESQIQNHTAYIKGWLEAANTDIEHPENELYRAMSNADKTAETIVNNFNEIRKSLGKEVLDLKENSIEYTSNNDKDLDDERTMSM